jgi:MFS family permease
MPEAKYYEHNLRAYAWIKLLSKRVYLPLIAIYLVDVGKLSIAQVGLLTAVAAAGSLVFNIPTGYIADRTSRKSALTIGTILIAVSTLMYVLAPTFLGAIMATITDSTSRSWGALNRMA